MARYRTIKPELFSDGSLSECCRDARFLFVGLLPFVDDMGRRRYSAKQLKNEVFPGDTDIDAQKVGYWFQQLVKAGVVELYQIGSIQYFRLPNFLRHQRVSHPCHSVTPRSPTENGGPQCLCNQCKNGTLRSVDDPNFKEGRLESYRDGYCVGLIHGVVYASAKVCPSGSVTAGQEIRVVVKYLQDHPEELHHFGPRLVEDALAKVWPCGK